MEELNLYMLLLGCRPVGRNTEQHDIFFGIGHSVKDLIPQIKRFWPDSGTIHVDAWREVRHVGGFNLRVVPRADADAEPAKHFLYFLNLGGYKENEFDEFHYKMLVVATDKNEATRVAKKSAFYKHTSIVGAPSHIDDKFGVDVDEVHLVKDILAPDLKMQYTLQIKAEEEVGQDKLHLGYFPFNKL